MVLEWIALKLVGVVLILIGLFLTVFFPGIQSHQNPQSGPKFDVNGIIMGLILLVVGIYLIMIQ
ncbi:MAG: hypothetical protein JW754_00135 [Candidatus Aenigmarchaeota archaeon]|nr:hypothetical protein [Candidatus Aenigmarchaeota archaeon]